VTREVVQVQRDVLYKNDEQAALNRIRFQEANVNVLNLVSSPGAGKTTLLVRTITDLKNKINCAVIEGDQQTDNDARKIRKTGVKVTQINTNSACHLDAAMVSQALDEFDLASLGTLFIENVGNLVCPASYDLGEKTKIVLMSVTEGEDKPAKYPKMFRVSTALVITKLDLLPYVDFDLDKAIGYARKINPDIKVFTLSIKSEEGLSGWYDYLRSL